MLERFNHQAEQSVLGAIISEPSAIDEIHWLSSAMFYEHSHKLIYSALAYMTSQNKPIDIVTVAEFLENDKNLVSVGGLAYIGSLVVNSTGVANVKRYAEIVQEHHISRLLLGAVNDIRADMESAGDIYKKLERAQSLILAVTEKSDNAEPVFVRDLLAERLERIDMAYQGKVKLLSTGLIDLDKQLGGGIEGGSLIVVAASASMGKTALAIQLAESLQSKEASALIFSIEMSNGLIVDRMIANKSHIASDRLRTGEMEESDFDGLMASVPMLQNINMLLDDRTNKLNGMRSKARQVKRKYGLSCIVVDYIGLMLEDDDSRANSREQQISTITRGLKALAKELDVPVIALSQLNRKVSDRTNKRPLMSDLRDSGAIEQDADVIVFVYRDDYYDSTSQYRGMAELNVAKNRNGATGAVLVNFEKERTQFTNYAGGMQMQEIKPQRGAYYD